ncbi:MAG: hypothetical protein WDN25_18890 [Acetobacteraceae bacterium]
MILIFEMTWTGVVHAPGNSATIHIIARAWPEQIVRVHAEVTHLTELRRDAVLAALPNVEFVAIEVSPQWRSHPQIVSFRRLAQEFRTVRAALARVPRAEACLVFMISATATGVFAAAWAARLSGHRAGLQIGFHGNLNDVAGWRPRNPVTRALDARSGIEARHPVTTRFLVLETAIRIALAANLPAAAARTDVLPHPIATGEIPAMAGRPLAPPVRIGFVGLGTAAKGIDIFLSVAGRIRARWGDKVEFVHVGRIPPDMDARPLDVLAHPPSTELLTRDEFTARLASLHYVFLPFRSGYYDLSASGALIDALTWLKPIITSRIPLTEQFFREYGDIGVLANDETGLEAAIDEILTEMDTARYARQIEALRAARDARHVDRLAQRYRDIVTRGFPGLLD